MENVNILQIFSAAQRVCARSAGGRPRTAELCRSPSETPEYIRTRIFNFYIPDIVENLKSSLS